MAACPSTTPIAGTVASSQRSAARLAGHGIAVLELNEVGALPVYDDRFESMLSVGGRLFVIVGAAPVREAWLVTRGDDGCTREVLFETDVPPLVNAPRPEAFAF